MAPSTLTGDYTISAEPGGPKPAPLPSQSTSHGTDGKLRREVTGQGRRGLHPGTSRGQPPREPIGDWHPGEKCREILETLATLDESDCQEYTLAINSIATQISGMWAGASHAPSPHRQVLAATENAVLGLLRGEPFSEEKGKAIKLALRDLMNPVLTQDNVESVCSYLGDAGFSPASFINGATNCD